MIKYKLICNQCNLRFDSWFGSSNEYEKLKKKELLNCHSCNSKDVEKTLMAPKVINKKTKIQSNKEIKKLKNFNNKIKEFQKFVKKNFDYVGKNFAYEARLIHYNQKKKGVYGTASKKEIKELREEGIETHTMPWIVDKNN